jgi:hypothetical protein
MKPLPVPFLPGSRGWALCRILTAVVILFAVRPSLGSAGMVLGEKTELGGLPVQGQGPVVPAGQARESTTYIEGKRIRTETGGRVLVLDFDRGVLLTINPSDKTYSEMRLEDLREAQKQAMEWMKGLRAQMEEKMKTMPPESREAMQKKLQSLPEGVFGEEKPAKVTVKATGKQETVNGFDCKEYEVYEDGELATRYWLAPSVSTKAFDAYQKELSEWLGGMGPLGANRLKEWDHVRDKGFPIKVTRVKPIAGQFSLNREILRVEEKPLDEALFQPPKEYKRVESPQIPKFGGSPASTPPPK